MTVASERVAQALAEAIQRQSVRIVFAESCTAGWCSAWLSLIPGISEYLCGSAVTYRNGTKAVWLGVSAPDLADPQIGPVSETVARQMCLNVLERTPEAGLSVAVTGHLGPGAPPDLDGIIYVGTAVRKSDACQVVAVQQHHLPVCGSGNLEQRHIRQQIAVTLVYEAAVSALEHITWKD